MTDDDDLIRRGDVLAAIERLLTGYLPAFREHAQRRIAAIPAVTPRPMKDAPRDGVTLVVSEMLAKDLRAWADRQEVLEPAHSARRRDLISILHQISSHFLPHPPEGGSDE
jgi:hypothetical protein